METLLTRPFAEAKQHVENAAPDVMREVWLAELDAIADEPVGDVSLIPNVLHERNILALDITSEPALAKVFATMHRHARELAEAKKEHFFHGDNPLEHTHAMRDTLGYYRSLVEARRAGASEEELASLNDVARFNTETAFLEFYNKFTFDVGLKRRYAIHEELGVVDGPHDFSAMFENYLSPVQDESEVRRGCNEVAFVGLVEWLARQPAAEHLAVVKFSLRNQTPGVKGGYVPEIDKMQVQFSRFVLADEGINPSQDPAIGDIALETQPFYINGLAYDEAFINRFLRSIGAYSGEVDMTRAEIHGHPIMLDTRIIPDGAAFMRLLDEFYEFETGRVMMLGEPAEVNPDITYDNLEEVVAERRAKIASAVDRIHQVSDDLAESGAESLVVDVTLEDLRKKHMFDICKLDPAQALIAFNEETYQGILAAKQLEAEGRTSEAGGVYKATLEKAPDTGGCGEACGLKAVSLSGNNQESMAAVARAHLAADLGLKTFKNGKFYEDQKTQCGGCGSKGILRGANGAMCIDGCGKLIVDGVIKDPWNTLAEEASAWLAWRTEREPLFKSIGRVLREFALRQEAIEERRKLAEE